MAWKRNLLILAAAALGTCVLAFFWNATRRPESQAATAEKAPPPPMDQPFVTFVDPAKGPKDAKVTIVEFGDYACPYCKSAEANIERLLADHPASVRFVWKHAPSPLHAGSGTAAEAAACAARQGRFWDFHDALFRGQTPFDQASLAILAKETGLDVDAFGACLASGETKPLIDRTVTEAEALRLTGIPTLFINGKRHEGVLSYEQLLEAAGL